MGSQTPTLLVIDFSKLGQPGSPEWEFVRSQVWKASEQYGSFKVINYSKIPIEIPHRVMAGMKELFDLPLETLTGNVSSEPFGGYIGKSVFAPLFESVGIVHPDDPQKVEAFSAVFWPDGNPTFSKSINVFAKQAAELDKTIWRMIMESLGLDGHVDEHVESVIFSVRGIRYEAPESVEPKVGLDSHMDQGLTAILYGNHVDGLEVETKDGQWFAANYSEGSFIVVLGESYHAWTNGRVYSPYHRVRLSGRETKYTFGMFSGFREGYTVKAPDKLVDENHRLLYQPFDFKKFLAVRLEETEKMYNSSSIANYSPIKAYFGA